MNRLLPIIILSLAALTAPSLAHFPFIVADEEGATAKLYMSELLEPDPEVSIDLLAGSKLSVRDASGHDTPLTPAKAEHAMTLALPGDGTRVVHGVSDLGVMQRGKSPAHLLVYYPKTIVGDAFDPATVLGGSEVPIELIPHRAGDGVKLRLSIAGKPAAGAEVRVITPDGREADHTTDAHGFTPPFRAPGRYGAWARHWTDAAGERDGERYEQVRRYATIVFDFPPAKASAPGGATTAPSAGAMSYPPLPKPVASFGAAVSDGWLYIYGGHTAKRHSYSTASVSGQFHRLNLRDPRQWEPLPGGVGVQGMNLAAHGGRIYRAGGMQPHNAPGEPEDNRSLDLVQRFDPAKGAWETLPPLPTPRSSHDLIFVDDRLYVVGGWHMKGRGQDPVWVDTVDVLDVSAAELTWRSIPQPFARRALIAAAQGERLYFMGGMDGQDQVQPDVDVLDTATGQWSKGPPIPGGAREGFAPAACTFRGRLYLSVGSGVVFRLSIDGTRWQPYARSTPRIVHRMVPTDSALLLIGGASRAAMLDLIETVAVTE